MLRGWLHRLKGWWKQTTLAPAAPEAALPLKEVSRGALERVVLAQGVANTLFEDFQNHRRSPRGQEEIGWVLMGQRQGREALALAALPAGTQRQAGIAHVQFNPDAQELASRILRQNDKSLTILGVVHTHPGTMRYPSDGDYQGDTRWVRQLRGDGVFGIGTADAIVIGPQSDYQQTLGELCFSWYCLGEHDKNYRRLAVQIADGVDRAERLHAVWDVLENYAIPLNRLCRQLARVQLDVSPEPEERLLLVKIPLSASHQQLRLLLNSTEARYYWDRQNEVIAIDPGESSLDRAVYLILAELAKESPADVREVSLMFES